MGGGGGTETEDKPIKQPREQLNLTRNPATRARERNRHFFSVKQSKAVSNFSSSHQSLILHSRLEEIGERVTSVGVNRKHCFSFLPVGTSCFRLVPCLERQTASYCPVCD